MTSSSHSGLVTVPGKQSVEQIVQRIQAVLQANGVKIFAVIDHSGEAEQAGLYLRPTRLLIFGNPRAGTPLMIASPTSAIDLPLKILVWMDDEGRTQISYNSTAWMEARHSLPHDSAQKIDMVELLVATVAA